MTLLIAGLSTDGATIVADTYAYHEGCYARACGKLFLLSHHLAVMAGRGCSGLIGGLHSVINDFSDAATFDVLTWRLPLIVDEVTAALAEELRHSPGWTGGLDIIVGGWSAAYDRPGLLFYRRMPESAEGTMRVLSPGDVVCLPELETGVPSSDDVADPARVMAIAREQAAYFFRRDGTKGAGGVLVQARVTRDSIAIRHLGDIDAAEREAAA